MEHDFIAEEIHEIADLLEKDPTDVAAAYRLLEIAELLTHGHSSDFDFEYHHEGDEPKPQIEKSEDDEQDPPKEVLPVTRTKPFSVITGHDAVSNLTFAQMRQKLDEWLVPDAEFDTLVEATEYLAGLDDTGAVLRTDWDSGTGSIAYVIQ